MVPRDVDELTRIIRDVVREELEVVRLDIAALKAWRSQWAGIGLMARFVSQTLIAIGTVMGALWWLR